MNNSTEGIGENVEEEALMEHLKTLIAVVPIVVNITFIIIISYSITSIILYLSVDGRLRTGEFLPVIVSCKSAPS